MLVRATSHCPAATASRTLVSPWMRLGLLATQPFTMLSALASPYRLIMVASRDWL